MAAAIASELRVSVSTVKAHMRSISAKRDVYSRGQAVECARELGLTGHSR
jgi:ATP/maltotriose-dependent transcriptional regulator MalT